MSALAGMIRIVRAQNLLIVAGTMYLMRFFVVQPLLMLQGMELQMNEWLFLLLVLSTTLITAAGYVINDYFDTRTDSINRPAAVVVGRSLSRRAAITLHLGLNLTGFALALIVAVGVGQPFLSMLFLIIPVILWFYSTSYKRRFLLGNLVVSALTALVPLMVLLFELPLLYQQHAHTVAQAPWVFNRVIYWVGGYAIFAFLFNLIREIIKDIEDFEGDAEYGRRTLPVVMGVQNARLVPCTLILLTMVTLAYLFGAFLNFLPNGQFDLFTFLYLLVALVIPMFVLLVTLLTAQHKRQYAQASRLTKYIMLMGLLYAVFFRHIAL